MPQWESTIQTQQQYRGHRSTQLLLYMTQGSKLVYHAQETESSGCLPQLTQMKHKGFATILSLWQMPQSQGRAPWTASKVQTGKICSILDGWYIASQPTLISYRTLPFPRLGLSYSNALPPIHMTRKLELFWTLNHRTSCSIFSIIIRQGICNWNIQTEVEAMSHS